MEYDDDKHSKKPLNQYRCLTLSSWLLLLLLFLLLFAMSLHVIFLMGFARGEKKKFLLEFSREKGKKNKTQTHHSCLASTNSSKAETSIRTVSCNGYLSESNRSPVGH